jgi:hypothetical protein
MYRLWEGLKGFAHVVLILSVCWWAIVWTVGSWQAQRFLGPDDLIPTADKWLASWDKSLAK